MEAVRDPVMAGAPSCQPTHLESMGTASGSRQEGEVPDGRSEDGSEPEDGAPGWGWTWNPHPGTLYALENRVIPCQRPKDHSREHRIERRRHRRPA